MPIRIAALVLLLCSTALAAPLTYPGGIKPVTSVEGITEYSLPNGLRVLFFPDPTKQTVTVNITYFVGSRHEGYGETGMAHLLEHMLFQGTPKTPNVPKALTERGARPNGTTWLDRTNYFETMTATDANVEWALRFEADRMVNSFVAKKDLDSEMTVVRNEFESGENDPSGILMERVLSTAYLWHAYGKSTIGARSDIENVPIQRLQAFYRKHYQPDNAMLVIAGRFDEGKALKVIADSFGKLKRPARPPEPTYTVEPTQDGERTVTLRRVGDIQVATAAYHVPAGADEDFAAVDVLTQILGDVPSGRLHKALVETKKAASASAFNFQLREPGVLLASADLRKEDNLDAARTTLLATTEELAAKAPANDEVERAKTSLLKQVQLILNASDRVGIQLSEWAAMGDWRMFFLHRDRLKKVTGGDVQRVAAKYLKPSNRTVGVFVPTPKPDRSEIPAQPNVAKMVEGYKGDEALAVGEPFDPSPTNIDARTQREKLDNGFQIAVLAKKTRGKSVAGQINLRFGTEASLTHKRIHGDVVARMLNRGTKAHTRQQIKDELDKLNTRLSVDGSVDSVRISFETRQDQLPAVLNLAAELIRTPTFDAKEFELLKREMLAGAEQGRSEPQVLAGIALRRHLDPHPKGHPQYVLTVDDHIEAISQLKLSELQAFHATFYGPSNGEIALVGDVPAETTAQVKKLFGGWKSPSPFERVPLKYQEVAAADLKIPTPDKANAFFLAAENLQLRDDDPDYAAMYLANYMMGGGFLYSRFASRIREKDGISYGVGSYLTVSPLDRVGSFNVYAIYAPQNLARLEAAFKEEIEKVLKDGFTPSEVAKAKEGILDSRKVNRAQDAGVARVIASNLFLGRTYAYDTALEKKIAALTPAEVLTTLRKHLSFDKISRAKAGDFDAKQPPPPEAAPPAAKTKETKPPAAVETPR
ncbi:MAG: M16 family metallopeptidase [Myxococcaceae bacterium]